MCGRFALIAERKALQMAFPGFIFPDDLPPRYNIAPGQPVALIPNTGENRVQLFRWGLVPFWSRDPKIGNRLINARSETLAEKPAFRDAYGKRRCLILADGFYEWQQPSGRGSRMPYYIHLLSKAPFAFAGLWEAWRTPEGDVLFTCTILTTQPNERIQPIHNRMPVILPPEAYRQWLDPAQLSPPALQGLLVPYPAFEMGAYPVSTRVNNPQNDTPACIAPAGEQPEEKRE